MNKIALDWNNVWNTIKPNLLPAGIGAGVGAAGLGLMDHAFSTETDPALKHESLKRNLLLGAGLGAGAGVGLNQLDPIISKSPTFGPVYGSIRSLLGLHPLAVGAGAGTVAGLRDMGSSSGLRLGGTKYDEYAKGVVAPDLVNTPPAVGSEGHGAYRDTMSKMQGLVDRAGRSGFLAKRNPFFNNTEFTDIHRKLHVEQQTIERAVKQQIASMIEEGRKNGVNITPKPHGIRKAIEENIRKGQTEALGNMGSVRPDSGYFTGMLDRVNNWRSSKAYILSGGRYGRTDAAANNPSLLDVFRNHERAQSAPMSEAVKMPVDKLPGAYTRGPFLRGASAGGVAALAQLLAQKTVTPITDQFFGGSEWSKYLKESR